MGGGTLSTNRRAGDDVSNVTRPGTAREALDSFNRAVETAGGNRMEVEPKPSGDEEILHYEASDGTKFNFRESTKSGNPTVDVQIEKSINDSKTVVIKVRFIDPKDSASSDSGPGLEVGEPGGEE